MNLLLTQGLALSTLLLILLQVQMAYSHLPIQRVLSLSSSKSSLRLQQQRKRQHAMFQSLDSSIVYHPKIRTNRSHEAFASAPSMMFSTTSSAKHKFSNTSSIRKCPITYLSSSSMNSFHSRYSTNIIHCNVFKTVASHCNYFGNTSKSSNTSTINHRNNQLKGSPTDDNYEEEDVASSTSTGTITIYNEQKTLPNINIQTLEKTISTIRSIIGYPTYQVNLILVDDEYMKEINLDTRGIDKPTDILSFPLHDTKLGGAKGAGDLEDPEFDIPEYYSLGDMIVDVPYVMRRMEEDKLFYENVSETEDNIDHNEDEGEHNDKYEYEYEDYVGDDDRGVSGAMANVYDIEKRIQLLLVHGMLHLVGYDHIEDDDYEVMVSKEEEVIKLLQILMSERI